MICNPIPFFRPASDFARAAIFMSGAGSNAEVLLRRLARSPSRHYQVVLLVTDAPRRSRAAEIATEFRIPFLAIDIREFYRTRGLESISLATPRGREVREAWTDALRRLIAPYRIDFGILAGFVPLTNLTADFPCLNVHPGDLTRTDDAGRRRLAGLHTVPMETALAEGLLPLRSSVILAQPYSGNGRGEMDSGPVLGVSVPVEPILEGHTPAELAAVRAARPAGRRPAEPDLLARLAAVNLEHLKRQGDHVVFPPVVEAFAAGRYARDGRRLLFRTGDDFVPVRTVEYGRDFANPLESGL